MRADLLQQPVAIFDAGFGAVLFEVAAITGRPSLLTVIVVDAAERWLQKAVVLHRVDVMARVFNILF